jgi:hypothetical protein
VKGIARWNDNVASNDERCCHGVDVVEEETLRKLLQVSLLGICLARTLLLI